MSSRIRGAILRSSEQFVNDMPVNVRQPALDAVVIERQPLVVDAEQVQNRGVEIVVRHRVRADRSAKVVGRAVGEAGLETGTAIQTLKAFWL